MLIRAAEVAGCAPLDVRIAGGRIAEIGAGLSRARGEPDLDARGGALLPGLHDHHVHLHALAAAQTSIACGPPAVMNADQLAAALRRAAQRGGGWLRGVAYHESVAGPLAREQLDAWVADRPVRVQHRSGALWVLNSAGVAELERAGACWPDGAERDARGRLTGRLFRADAWLRERLRGALPDLAAVGAQLAAFGVTGATDASAANDRAALRHLCDAAGRGALPQQLLVMGEPDLPEPACARTARGAVKALLDDRSLPDFGAFCARIRAAHGAGRAYAVHCATRAQGLFAAAAFREAGTRRGDRLEHASVAPPELVALAAELGLAVVTQPHFIAERGDDYRRDVDPADLPWLYRAQGWLAAGVPLAAGSDAPYGSSDPWQGIAAAVRRASASGAVLGAGEALTPEQAFALYSAPLGDPGGPARGVTAGAAADLCLLDRPWRDARARLSSEDVRATWCAGELVWQRGGEPGK
ncbi:MAG TPA: amidohydrolase family protein [Myxococcota bacterium]|nr:amidohydrolase family protein [Myxococcota bacterium]